jgi:hypothetical protein
VPTTPVHRDSPGRPASSSRPAGPAQGALLLGFFVAASIGAMWAVLLAMGRATRRAWSRAPHERDL